MATAITPTLISGPGTSANGVVSQFTLLLASTDGSGLQTLDLTAYFKRIKNYRSWWIACV